MSLLSFRGVLAVALIAGVVAAISTSLFHFVLTEPVIDRAIQLEEQAHQGEAHEEPVVSREIQKTIGLLTGFVLVGLSWGLLFTIAYHLLQRRLSLLGLRRGAIVLAILAFWSLVLIPLLKYPANPPGVGDPETIEYRQTLYLGFLVMSVAATALAVQCGTWLAARLAIGSRWPVIGICLVLFAGVLFVIMPSNPDAGAVPADLVGWFRVLSLAGLGLFWTVFGLCFAWLAPRFVDRTLLQS